jgi:hypothetical protein
MANSGLFHSWQRPLHVPDPNHFLYPISVQKMKCKSSQTMQGTGENTFAKRIRQPSARESCNLCRREIWRSVAELQKLQFVTLYLREIRRAAIWRAQQEKIWLL